MREHKSLRSQDILVLLRLMDPQARRLRQIDLASELGISATEVSSALNRLSKAKLIGPNKKPLRQSVIEFLLYGIKYFYPVEPGALTRGIPTAHSAPPLDQYFSSQDIQHRYVWPFAEGKEMGQAIVPLYKSAPELKKSCPLVYEFLTLIDAIRVGRAREVKMAEKELINSIDKALAKRSFEGLDL